MDNYLDRLAVVCVWDPDEEGMEPFRYFDVSEINRITSDYLHEHVSKEWLNRYGGGLAVAKRHPTGVNISLITGVLKLEDYTRRVEDSWHLTDKYIPYTLPNLLPFARAACRILTKRLDEWNS